MSHVRPLRFTANIGSNAVRITDSEVERAVAPAVAVRPTVRDLGARYADATAASWRGAIADIKQAVEAAQSDADEPLAVFGFAPIPMLMALGALLGDKTPAQVFDRHRHRADVVPDEAWCWEPDGDDLAWRPFHHPPFQRGATDVALLLSVSGRVDPAAVMAAIPKNHPQYVLELEHPQTNVVRTRAQLASFARRWREALDEIRGAYGDRVRVNVFPAVPLSVAIECGRRLLHVDPPLRIFNAAAGVFTYALTVGPAGVSRELDASIRESIDILVLVALEEEFEQLHALLPPFQALPDHEHGGCDYFCELGPRRVIVRLVGGMGTGNAQLVADRAIERWSPFVAVWVGIAAGIHSDVKLADVLVPDQIDGYDANLKAVDGDGGSYVFKERGEVFRLDHVLAQGIQNLRFAHAAAYEAWVSTCATDLRDELAADGFEVQSSHVRERPAIKVGHVASGNVVGAAEAFTARLLTRDSSLLGLEMETAGLTRAAHNRAKPVRTLALRGVSDFGDARKSELDKLGAGVFRRVAMRNASRLLLTLIEVGIL